MIYLIIGGRDGVRKRNIFFVVIGFLILLSLTGCGKKTAITTADFKSITESHSYTTVDVTSQYASYGNINEATVAQSPDGFQVEFYVLDDEGNATSMFNTNKSDFESYKGNYSSESSSSMSNYSSYTLTSSGYYMHLCRVDNTLLYVKVSDTYKDSVKDLINELGY